MVPAPICAMKDRSRRGVTKPSDMGGGSSRSTTTVRACMSRGRFCVVIGSRQCERDEVVEDEDAGGGGDDRSVDGAADAGSAAFDGEAELAAREGHDDAEDDALDEAVH